MFMSTTQTSIFWKDLEDQGIIAPDLSPVEKELRDRFVKEYMFDRSRVAAAIRCGFNAGFAQQYADKFWGEPYVQQKIKEAELIEKDKDTEATEDEREVLRTLREAMKVGPYNSRVAAANKMATIRGMDAPTKSEQTILHRGGVMKCPGVSSIEQWEEQAMDSQTKLVSDTQE